MPKQKKCKIQCIFSIEDCPADWCGTPDANCLCCEYICGLYIRKGEIFVKCNYPKQIITMEAPQDMYNKMEE